MYPWQQSQWHILQEARQQGRMPHALLLTGPKGLGKEHFAQEMAQALLCEANTAQGGPCGECRSCLLYAAGNHPDVAVVKPLEGKKNIAVDQVRELSRYLTLKAQYGGHRVVVLAPAEAMNVNSANSLLKTLEEPSEGAVLLLVTHRPAQLPATIRSRCQEIRFQVATAESGEAWLRSQGVSGDPKLLLALADGAPLKAKALADDNIIQERQDSFNTLENMAKQTIDPIGAAASWVKAGPEPVLSWFYLWSVDMVRLKSCQTPPHVSNQDIQSNLLNLANQVSLKALLLWQERVQSALREIEGNSNATLVMESVLMYWQAMFRRRQARGALSS
ncbi:DNA polymerase III subunit delta' [Pseudomonadota bacterium]